MVTLTNSLHHLKYPVPVVYLA